MGPTPSPHQDFLFLLIIAIKGDSEEKSPSDLSRTSSLVSGSVSSCHMALTTGTERGRARRVGRLFPAPGALAPAQGSCQGRTLREARCPWLRGPELFWRLIIGHHPVPKAHHALCPGLVLPPPRDRFLVTEPPHKPAYTFPSLLAKGHIL